MASRLRDFSRPELVRFTGEVTEVRLNPTTHVSSYSGGFRSRRMTSSWASQVGAMTVRVGGKPVTCLIDMRTRNIGVMPGNNVTVWGIARVWKPGSDIPESVDVKRLACEETGEVHPQGWGGGSALIVVPVIFCMIFGFSVFFMFTFLFSDSFFFGSYSLLILVSLAPAAVIPLVLLLVFAAGRRSSVGRLDGYVEVGSPTSSDRIMGYAKRCVVCNLPIGKGDQVVYCPHCGNQAHREHMLEWLHVHDYCPACEKHLDEQSF